VGKAKKTASAGRSAIAKAVAKRTPEAATANALESVLAHVEAAMGPGMARRLTSKETVDVDVVPTGVPSLNKALGVGGLPIGRVIEIFGPNAAGKTSLALLCLAGAQRRGFVCAFVDAEHALSPVYAAKLGVDLDTLVLGQPDSGEEALGLVESLVDAGARFIVVDSVAALVPQAEIDGEMGDTHIALQARLMSQSMRKLTGKVSRAGAIVVFINQIRHKIGVMFGSNETTPGGNALRFYSSVRIDIRKIGTVKDGDRPIGTRSRVKIVKNKVAQPFLTCELEFTGFGYDRGADVLAMALASGAAVMKGSWVEIGGDKWQGRVAAAAALNGDPERVAALLALL